MSEILSVEGQLVGIPVEKYTGVSGIVVDPVNKTIRADETILWEGVGTSGTFSESLSNFERIRVLYVWNQATANNKGKYAELPAEPQVFSYLDNGKAGNDYHWFSWGSWQISDTGFALLSSFQTYGGINQTTAGNSARMYKVVGINRKAQ